MPSVFNKSVEQQFVPVKSPTPTVTIWSDLPIIDKNKGCFTIPNGTSAKDCTVSLANLSSFNGFSKGPEYTRKIQLESSLIVISIFVLVLVIRLSKLL